MTNNLIRNTITDEENVETVVSYDALGRKKKVEMQQPDETIETTCDKLHRVTSKKVNDDGTTYEYADVLSREVTITTPQAEEPIVIEHDDEGLRKKLTDPDGNVLSYWRNPCSQVTHIRDGESESDPAWVENKYDGGNRPTERWYGDSTKGIKTLIDYDDDYVSSQENRGMNRVTHIKHFKVVEQVETLLIHLEHPADQFDDLGNRKQMKRTLFPFLDGRFGTGSHVNYGYDKTSQLTSEQYYKPASPDPLQFLSRTNVFDNAGNRKSLVENNNGMEKTVDGTFDAANGLADEALQYADVAAQQWLTVVERDPRGNTTKKTIPPGAGREKEEIVFGYNRRNNLTKVTRKKLGKETETSFKYNADGLRVEKRVEQASLLVHQIKYILDGVHVLLERDGEDETQVRHIPGVCTIHNPTSENPLTRFDLHDALGSVIAQVSLDEDEPQITWAAQYDAYGKKLAETSETPSPYQWGGAHGYYADEDAGMYLMGLRWYDAFTGRFITRDPIGYAAGDMNPYRPMGNNPVNAVDPWGLIVDPGGVVIKDGFLHTSGKAADDPDWKNVSGADLTNLTWTESSPSKPSGGSGESPALDTLEMLSYIIPMTRILRALFPVRTVVPYIRFLRYSPSFASMRSGQLVVIPKGVQYSAPAKSGEGIVFAGGRGGYGLHPNIRSVRIMDPRPSYPEGYVNYGNATTPWGPWQTMNPNTGKIISRADPNWHIKP